MFTFTESFMYKYFVNSAQGDGGGGVTGQHVSHVCHRVWVLPWTSRWCALATGQQKQEH